MCLSTRDEMNALHFAKQHDWGRNARLEQGRIVDLEDITVSQTTGGITRRTVTLPATFDAVLSFGGY